MSGELRERRVRSGLIAWEGIAVFERCAKGTRGPDSTCECFIVRVATRVKGRETRGKCGECETSMFGTCRDSQTFRGADGLTERGSACRAVAGVAGILEMVETVNNATLSVEFSRNHIEKLVVILLEFPPYCIRDEIGVLDDSR